LWRTDILRITNRGKRDYKWRQRLQIGAGLQIGARGNINKGRDYKSGQGLQIGAEHKSTKKPDKN